MQGRSSPAGTVFLSPNRVGVFGSVRVFGGWGEEGGAPTADGWEARRLERRECSDFPATQKGDTRHSGSSIVARCSPQAGYE